MKKYEDYINEQCELALNENTSQIGKTDVFSGSSAMGFPNKFKFFKNENSLR